VRLKRLLPIFFLIFFCSLALDAQTWKEINDSLDYYIKIEDYEKALPWGELALSKVKSEFGTYTPLYPLSRGELFDTNYSKILTKLGDIYYYTGDKLKSLEYYKLDSSAREAIYGKNSIEYANSLWNLAFMYSEAFSYSQAESLLLHILYINKLKLGEDNLQYASSLNDLALLYRKIGNYAEAESLYKQAIKIFKNIKDLDSSNYAISLNNLALVEQIMGNYKESEKLYKEALEIVRNFSGKSQLIYAKDLNNLAGLYYETHKLQESEQLYNKSLEIYEKVLGAGNTEFAQTLNNLAGIYEDMGNYNIADTLYNLAIKIWEKASTANHTTYASFLGNLGQLYYKIHKNKEAEELLLRSGEIKRNLLGSQHPDYASLLGKLADLYDEMGDGCNSEFFFKKSLSIYLNQIDKTFPYLSENEKNQFYSTIKFRFEKFNSFAIKYSKQKPEILSDIYNNQIILKAILFNATKKVRERILNSGDSLLIEKYKRWIDTKEYLSRLYRLSLDELKRQNINLEQTESIANELERDLSKGSEIFSKIYEKKKITWLDVKKCLKKNEAAIEIIRIRKYGWIENIYNNNILVPDFTDSVYYAFLIITSKTKGHPDLVLLDNGFSLENKFLNQYRNAKNFDYLDRDSYKAYWSKIEPKLKNIKKIYISSDGVYNQLNINTFYNLNTDKYLLDDYNIYMVSNSKDIIKIDIRQEIRDKRIAYLFGNPKFDKDSGKPTIKPLPGTKKEIEKIGNLLRVKNWIVHSYLDSTATEENLKTIISPRVLHIATHGLFLEDIESQGKFNIMESQRYVENPLLRSMLLFAGAGNTSHPTPALPKGEGEDGFLTAYEAMNLNLDNTELVVLSACETGLGEIKNGEGVYGLQRALQVAGAKSIIMSLWSVSDEATQELMVNFYEKWLSGKNNRDAFREAQIELKKRYPGFYYWGAFVMVGE
jgi:CHAT domain-containing protein